MVKMLNLYVVDLTKVSDEFEKIRYDVNQKFVEIETFLNQRDEIKGSNPRDILLKTQLQEKIDQRLDYVRTKIDQLGTTLSSQKKNKKKFPDVQYKQDALTLIEDRVILLRNKNDGLSVEDKEMTDNRTHLEQLDDLLIKRAAYAPPDREMYEEEHAIEKDWKNRVQVQDDRLAGVGVNLKIVKKGVEDIAEGLDRVDKATGKTDKMASATETQLKTTNAKLKDLLGKLRSGDRICIDIILVCVCLGLIAILYNIIQSKFIKPSTTTTTTTPTTKTFLIL